MIECFKKGLVIRAFTHDIDKFRPATFTAYAKYMYIDKEKYKEEFRVVWLKHRSQRHHLLMSPFFTTDKDIQEALCDWRAMAKTHPDNEYVYWCNNRDSLPIHYDVKVRIEALLGINKMHHVVYNVLLSKGELEHVKRHFSKENRVFEKMMANGDFQKCDIQFLRQGDIFRMYDNEKLYEDEKGMTELRATSNPYKINGVWTIKIRKG